MIRYGKYEVTSVHLAPNHEPIAANTFVTLVYAFVNIVKNHVATAARAVFMSFHLAANHEPIAEKIVVIAFQFRMRGQTGHVGCPALQAVHRLPRRRDHRGSGKRR